MSTPVLIAKDKTGRKVPIPAIKGESGITFIPSVSEDGIISWSNDGGLENPAEINIKGEKGDKGEQGATGLQGVSGVHITTNGERPEGTIIEVNPNGGVVEFVTTSEMETYVMAAINGSLDEIEALIDESGVLE